MCYRTFEKGAQDKKPVTETILTTTQVEDMLAAAAMDRHEADHEAVAFLSRLQNQIKAMKRKLAEPVG